MNSEIELMELLHRINKEIAKRLTPIFREKKLSVAELSVLMRMNRQPVCRATELAAMIGVPTSTVTGILDRLENRGLLERSQDPDDRRSVQITATQNTEEFVTALKRPMEDLLRTAFRSMPASRTRRLVQDLKAVLEVLERENSTAE
jgi:DNA-binding MarR family transcriptional regulator